MEINETISVVQIADKILLQFDEFRTDFNTATHNAGFSNETIKQHNLLTKVSKAKFELEHSFKYIEPFGSLYILTPLGKDVKRAGGHFAYFKKNEEKSIADTERQRLNDEKLKYDLKNAKRIFKTYWWTFGISIVGFLLALGKIIYDIVKAK